MSIILKPTTDKSIISREATKSTITILNTTPTLLVKFLADIVDGEHKKWNIYKAEYSRIMCINSKGRPEPATRKGGIPIARTERQAKIYRNWGAVHTPSLNLGRLHNPVDKIKAILGADCSPKIKAELLEVVDCDQ